MVARNWVETGNPIYPQDLGLGLPINPVHAGLIATYRTIFGVRAFSGTLWLRTATDIVKGAPLAVLVGVPGLFLEGKRGASLAVAVLLVGLLWLRSVGYTSGGVGYSLRVLTPAWVALSVVSGAFGPLLHRSNGLIAGLARVLVVLAIVTCGGYATLSCWAHPAGPAEVLHSVRSTRSEPLDRYPTMSKSPG